MRTTLTALLLVAPLQQAESLKITLEALDRRFDPAATMKLRFTIENLTDGELTLDEPLDWADGLEIRDAKDNIIKAAGTSREAKRTNKVDGRGFIGRTVDVVKALAGKKFEEGVFKIRWCWLGRTSAEVRVIVVRNYHVKVVTNFGDFTIEFFPDSAPHHVLHFLSLVRTGFYDKKKFYRVIAGSIAQAGNQTGEADVKLKAEFNERPHKLGTLSAARQDHPDTASSEIFFSLADQPQFNGRYTVFGQVREGLEALQDIGRVKTDHSPCSGCGKRLQAGYADGHCGNHHQDTPEVDVIIKSMTVVESQK